MRKLYRILIAAMFFVTLLGTVSSALPAEKTYEFQFTTDSNFDGGYVYFDVNVDTDLILNHLRWADEYNICGLLKYNPYVMPFEVIYYSTVDNNEREINSVQMLSYSVYTASNCYENNAPIAVRYPTRVRIILNGLDSSDGNYAGVIHTVELKYLWPIYIWGLSSLPVDRIEIPRDAVASSEPYFTGSTTPSARILYRLDTGREVVAVPSVCCLPLIIPTIYYKKVTLPLDRVAEFIFDRGLNPGGAHAYWIIPYNNT